METPHSSVPTGLADNILKCIAELRSKLDFMVSSSMIKEDRPKAAAYGSSLNQKLQECEGSLRSLLDNLEV